MNPSFYVDPAAELQPEAGVAPAKKKVSAENNESQRKGFLALPYWKRVLIVWSVWVIIFFLTDAGFVLAAYALVFWTVIAIVHTLGGTPTAGSPFLNDPSDPISSLYKSRHDDS